MRPARRPGGGTLSRAEAWSSHLANLAAGGTGLVYAWTCYLVEPADPFAVVNHPWQPALRHLHVLAAPLLLFACGWIGRDHAWRRVRSGHRERRRSGLALFLLVAPMALSGYLLQTGADERWRQVWVVVHVASSCLWVVAYLAHQLAPRRAGPASAGGGQPGVRG